MSTIDLRSDTVTRPTAAMRDAMMEAAVGDDVFGEDPTAVELQNRIADILGKEAALFVPSGVMGNQLAVKVHTAPGDEVLCESGCHIANYESGAPGVLSGVQLRTIPGARGIMTAEQVRAAIRPGHYWEPQPRLVAVENTHNRAGGVVQPHDVVRGIVEVARENGLATHLDGARLWNAAVHTGMTEAELAAPFDTVSVCLSKGLGAPVGSVLAGSAEMMHRARRYRKMFGGGMRQIGILAAAGLHALEHHRSDLVHDHERAQRLAESIAALPGFRLDPASVETNIVIFDVENRTAEDVLAALREDGVLMVAFGPQTIRATTHRDVGDDDVDRAIDLMRRRFAAA